MSKIATALKKAAAPKIAAEIMSAAVLPAGMSTIAAERIAQGLAEDIAAAPATQAAIEAVAPAPIAWWKTQSIVSNVVAILIALATIYALFRTGTANEVTLTGPVGIILANGSSIYGRVTARRPIAGTQAARDAAAAA